MPLHIIVCIKTVVRAAPGGAPARTPDNSDFNPFDRPALEAALQLKAHQGGTVTVLSMGPAAGSATLAEACAMGADRSVLISDKALAGSDTLVTARVLAAGIRRLAPFDFVVFGPRTTDSDTGQVGAQTAAVLDLPLVSGVQQLALQEGRWEIRRSLDDWEELWQVQPPAALIVHARAFHPRPVSLARIGATYARPMLETWGLADLGLAPAQVGLAGSPTRVAALQPVQRKRTCEMLAGEPREQVEALLERLSVRGVMGS